MAAAAGPTVQMVARVPTPSGATADGWGIFTIRGGTRELAIGYFNSSTIADEWLARIEKALEASGLSPNRENLRKAFGELSGIQFTGMTDTYTKAVFSLGAGPAIFNVSESAERALRLLAVLQQAVYALALGDVAIGGSEIAKIVGTAFGPGGALYPATADAVGGATPVEASDAGVAGTPDPDIRAVFLLLAGAYSTGAIDLSIRPVTARMAMAVSLTTQDQNVRNYTSLMNRLRISFVPAYTPNSTDFHMFLVDTAAQREAKQAAPEGAIVPTGVGRDPADVLSDPAAAGVFGATPVPTPDGMGVGTDGSPPPLVPVSPATTPAPSVPTPVPTPGVGTVGATTIVGSSGASVMTPAEISALITAAISAITATRVHVYRLADGTIVRQPPSVVAPPGSTLLRVESEASVPYIDTLTGRTVYLSPGTTPPPSYVRKASATLGELARSVPLPSAALVGVTAKPGGRGGLGGYAPPKFVSPVQPESLIRGTPATMAGSNFVILPPRRRPTSFTYKIPGGEGERVVSETVTTASSKNGGFPPVRSKYARY